MKYYCHCCLAELIEYNYGWYCPYCGKFMKIK